MERHNTDDLFKKMLENPPPLRPEMEALEDMNRRLDAAQTKHRNGAWWWLLPLLFLPFLFGSIFFYFKYQTAQNSLDEINLQLRNQQLITSTDTLTQRITIYQYDTIYNRIYQDVIIKRNISKTSALLASNGSYFAVSTLPNFGAPNLTTNPAAAFNTFDKSSLQPSQLELLRDGKALSLSQIAGILDNNLPNNSSSVSKNSFINLPLNNIASLAFLENRFNQEHPLPESDHFLNLTAKSNVDRINPLWYLVPTGFQAGFNWSPLGIANLPGSNNKVKSIGFLGDIEFTRNTRLQFGIEYLSAPLKAESATELSQFPTAIPDDPADLFSELYGDFTYLQVPLTLKYVFQPTNKWKPSIGVGIIARLPLKEQFRYEFVSAQNGEYKQVQVLNDGVFSLKNVRGTIGLEYNFYKNYTIQAEGFYNYQFGETTNPYVQFRYGGLNMGLKYKF